LRTKRNIKMQKIKREDEVIVIAGRDKGKRGSVSQVLAGDRLYVAGVNMVKKHTKANPQMGQPGGILEKEAPIQLSNVAIYNPGTSKADRVGIKYLDDGRKVRIFKSTGEEIDA
jgi:large subunit ribosomal protein L24